MSFYDSMTSDSSSLPEHLHVFVNDIIYGESRGILAQAFEEIQSPGRLFTQAWRRFLLILLAAPCHLLFLAL